MDPHFFSACSPVRSAQVGVASADSDAVAADCESAPASPPFNGQRKTV